MHKLVELFSDIDNFSRVFIPQWFSISSPNFTFVYRVQMLCCLAVASEKVKNCGTTTGHLRVI